MRASEPRVTEAAAASDGELVRPEGTQDGRTQASGPDRGGARRRADFGEPRLLHLLTRGKALNALT